MSQLRAKTPRVGPPPRATESRNDTAVLELAERAPDSARLARRELAVDQALAAQGDVLTGGLVLELSDYLERLAAGLPSLKRKVPVNKRPMIRDVDGGKGGVH